MNDRFWKDKRVLITGHTGFQGGWLSLWLQNLGARVVGYALDPPTQPNLFEIAKIGSAMISLRGDVRNLGALREALTTHRPEIVFHLAAQSLVRASYESPVETFSTNMMGSLNLLETLREGGYARAIVVITSDKCYEPEKQSLGYRESDKLGGEDPYSSSKACAEHIVSAYRSSYFKHPSSASFMPGIATARAGNVIGGGDWSADRLVPDIVKALAHECPLLLRNPAGTRPWQHVLEALRGYLNLAEKLWVDPAPYSEAWNFGRDPQESKEVSWIAEKFLQLWGTEPKWIHDTGSHPHEDLSLKLDSSKSKKRLGWIPLLPLDETLEWTVKWYRAYLEQKEMREFTLNQILSFSGKGS